jgi:C4-dicarboxylate-binding protein DctP
MARSAVWLAALALACLTAAAPQSIVIRFSHVVAADTPKGKASEFFRKRAEELTRGRVRVEVYPNSTLYKDKEELEALQLGAVQMLAPSLAKFGPLGVREFEVFDLPYLFDDYPELHKVTQGAVGQALLERLEPAGIKGLAYWDNGFKVFSSNKPIRTVAQFKGQKMRIQPSKVLDAQMRALGALPVVLPFSEVHHTLRAGLVDGTENPPSNLYTQQMHEVQRYVNVSNHGYLGYAVVANRKFWEGLPGDIRAQLEQAVRDATEYANRIAKAENDEALQAVRSSRQCEVLVPSAAEKAALKKVLVRTHAELAERVGRDLVKSIYRATGFDPGKL